MGALPSVSSVPSGLLLYLSGLQLSLSRSQGVGLDGGLANLNEDQSPLWSLMSIQRLRPNPTENPAQEIGGTPGGSEGTVHRPGSENQGSENLSAPCRLPPPGGQGSKGCRAQPLPSHAVVRGDMASPGPCSSGPPQFFSLPLSLPFPLSVRVAPRPSAPNLSGLWPPHRRK